MCFVECLNIIGGLMISVLIFEWFIEFMILGILNIMRWK